MTMEIDLKKQVNIISRFKAKWQLLKGCMDTFLCFLCLDTTLEKIEFDEIFWLDLLHHIKLFWKTFIFPELILSKVKKATNDGKIDFQLNHSYEFPEEPMDIVLVD